MKHTAQSSAFVEVLALSADEQGLWVRTLQAPQSGRIVEQVWSMVGHDGSSSRAVHSTSWRQDESGAIILTWVVAGDPSPSASPRELCTPAPRTNTGRLDDPAPRSIPHDEVVGHAIAHLCFLMRRDRSDFLTAWGEDPHLWSHIELFDPDRCRQLS